MTRLAAKLAGLALVAILGWLFYVGWLTGIPGPGREDPEGCLRAVADYKHTHSASFARGWRVYIKTGSCEGRTW